MSTNNIPFFRELVYFLHAQSKIVSIEFLLLFISIKEKPFKELTNEKFVISCVIIFLLTL